MKKYGNVFPIGVEEFAKNVNSTSIEDDSKINYKFKSLKKYNSNNDPFKEVTDIDLFNLFMYGQVQENKINSSQSYNNYLVRRNKIDATRQWIEMGQKYIVVHASLGNGKSILLKQIASEFSSDYDCYFVRQNDKNIIVEYEMLMRSKKKSIIFIDGYLRYSDFIKSIAKFSNNNIILILCERTFSNEFLIDIDIEYHIFNINRMQPDEIDQLAHILIKYPALLSKKLGYNDVDNLDIVKDFIEHKCRKNFQSFLIEIIKSEDIVNRYSEILNGNKSIKLFNIINLILINSFMGLGLTVDNMCYLLDTDYFYEHNFSKNKDIKELFKIENDFPVMSSSILAHLLSKRMTNIKIIFDNLFKIAQRAEKVKKFSTNDIYYNLLKRINSYTDLRKLYGESDGFHDYITEYFRKLQNLNFFKRNSHFWLQYAISRLDIGDIEYSEKCFSMARKYVKQSSYTQLFIDNHYSRLLLEKAYKKSKSNEEAFQLFKRAHELLINPIFIQEEWNYIFKVALNYEAIFNKFYKEMDKNRQSFLIQSVIDISDLLKQFKDRVDSYYIEERSNIEKCTNMVNRILKSYR